MPHIKRDGRLKKAGPHKKIIEAEDVKFNSKGVFVPAGKTEPKFPVPIPPAVVVSPVNFIEGLGMAIVQRIDCIAISGTLKDAVKLKANQVLLNKILPDLTRNEQVITESPYEKILRAINEKKGGENDGI